MKIKYKETEIKFNIKKTYSNIGLTNNDYWCDVDFYVKNSDIEYESHRQSLTFNEVEKNVKKINDFYNSEENEDIIITFIKNYFMIYLYKEDNNIIMDFELRDTEHPIHRNYKIKFVNEEILEFLKISVIN